MTVTDVRETADQTRVAPAPTPPSARHPRWERPAFISLVVGTALLYLWGLGASGWANAYYSAAAQAASASWKAMFFGSFDASSFITVDKTPASMWLMGLSARIFGVNSWSILVPEALCGVAAVALLYATVRRWFTPGAALIAGSVMALTPVATLMFRFNNPDALLVLLLVAGAYAVTRAVERGRTTWLLLAGAFVGFGFLTKMLQAFLVIPAFGLVYLFAAPVRVRTRIWQLFAALGSMIVAAGWWIAAVSLWPASSRPYIGGSQSNSILELTLGYNGFGRITGDEVGSVGGGGGGNTAGGMWGETGIGRLFNSEIGGQISWLLPAALILLVAGLALTLRAPRTSRLRAALILWGGWLIVTGVTFSLMAGIFHAYYTVALAPAVGALVGIGTASLWQHRTSPIARSVLAVTLAVTAVWSFVLLGRSSDYLPWLRYLVIAAGLLGAAALFVGHVLPKVVLPVVAGLGIAAALAGPAAYAVDTASTPHTGSIPTAGPASAGGFGGGRMGGPGGAGGFGGRNGGQFPGGQTGTAPQGTTPNGAGTGTGTSQNGTGSTGTTQNGAGGNGFPGGGMGGGMGGAGGLLNASTPSSELVTLLADDSSAYTWVAAAVGSQNAAGYQLATGDPVMSLGGFNGSDPSISLADFQKLVAAKKVHYFLGSGGGGFGGRSSGGSNSAQEIASWVAENYTAQTVGGATVYDLTK
nr:glycosyltransferase family 39 protein [Hamadaea tsunoensis]